MTKIQWSWHFFCADHRKVPNSPQNVWSSTLFEVHAFMGIYDGKNQNHSLNRRYTAVFSVVTQRSSPLTPHLFTIKTPPTLLQKNKNPEQRRKFHIALLTKKVSTPISEGVYGIFVRTYLLNSSNSFTKESAKIFTKCFPKNTLQASTRRGSKSTLRNWLRSV